ncbi:ATP synthase subunit I [Salinibacillus xinjiangensis]|uniref:ATP synthase subunit I n=1 Tax=Salinibacillus xinjiangensis TaxID=1229268 RepID=A0A6G1X5P3_9BACI|nr:ATP synthase subunit I [Salinibacillus xinjiangensis]MRG86200.1 ATP synthase subunit I [Salinibacillus xinjiangensis]
MQYKVMVNRQRKWMLYVLALFVLGWGLTPYPDIFLGLLLGSSISFFNLWLLQRKVNQVGQAAAKQVTARALGTFSRFASAVLAVLIALRYPQHFHMIAVVIGLMTIYFVIMIDFFVTSQRSKP